MPKMIAAKGFTYATRRLLPEDPFTARTRGDARALVALGRARYVTVDGRADDGKAPKPKPEPKGAPKQATAKAPRAARKPKQA